jgi:hypothetical protein
VDSYPEVKAAGRAGVYHSSLSGGHFDHWGDPGVDGRIIFRWILRKWDVRVRTGLSWLMIGTGGRHL